MRYEILGMGRERTEMTLKLKGLDVPIQNHIWKIYAYHKDRPNDINGWLEEIDNYIKELRRYNVSTGKGKSKFNYKKSQLKDRLTDTLFGKLEDVEVLEFYWGTHKNPFPRKEITNQDVVKLQHLCNKFIKCILTLSMFVVDTEELR